MKPKRVSGEVVPALSPENQLHNLREYLAASIPFSECRGMLGGGWGDIRVLDDEKFDSPKSVEEECKRRQGLLRVLLTKLARLRKSGQMAAYQELYAALVDERFVITGEDSPLHERKFGTLVMFDPERTIKLLRWLKLLHPKIIERHLGFQSQSGNWLFETEGLIDRPELRWLTDEVLGEWNTTPQCSRGPCESDEALRELFPRSLLPEGFESTDWFVEDGKWLDLIHNQYLCGWVTNQPKGSCPRIDERFMRWTGCALFFPGKDQNEVLSMFKRDKQDRIATWMLSFPAHVHSLDANYYPCSFGLFPEKDLPRFQEKWPAYTSGSRQGGMGAIVIDSGRRVPMRDPIFEVSPYRKAVEPPKLEHVGIELFLPYHQSS